MVFCKNCAREVTVDRFDGGLSCKDCGRVLENFCYSDEVTYIKNAAGQSQLSGNIVNSVQGDGTNSRQMRYRDARRDIEVLKDDLGIGDERVDVVDMAFNFYRAAMDLKFTKGRRKELVQSSCLYLTCREKKLPFLLIDFSSYFHVSVYELGSVYLRLCKTLFLWDDDQGYEKLVDPSIFIPRLTNRLLKGRCREDNDKVKDVAKTARDIIACMKRDWMQTGRKPSGICGAAIYIAALSHGIMCSTTDIGKIVHMCEATITKRLNEFANTETASLTVDELTERENELQKKTSTIRPNSDKGEVICKHKDSTCFGYGLCESCYEKFIEYSGGFVGGLDPPAFQRAEGEIMEKAAREENDGGIGKSERKTDWDAEALDESGNLSDLDGDVEVDDCLLNEDEKRMTKISWELNNREYLEEQAKAADLKSNANCPVYARNLVEASKAYVKQSRKEKQQKRAEEAKNRPPPETAAEAVYRELERKGKGRNNEFNYDLLDALFDTTLPGEKSPKRSKKSSEHEDNEEEEMSVVSE